MRTIKTPTCPLFHFLHHHLERFAFLHWFVQVEFEQRKRGQERDEVLPGPCCLSQLTDRGLCRIHVHDWCVLIDLVDSSCRFPSTSHLFPSIHLALFGFRLSPNAVKASNFSFLRFLLAILWFEQPQSKPHYRPWRVCLYCLCSSFHTSAVPSCGRLSRRVT